LESHISPWIAERQERSILMPTVQKFDRSMIEKYLKSVNLKYLRDSDGDFVAQFAYDEDTGCELTLYLIAAGQKNEIYVIRVLSDKRIPKSDWGRAMMLCNTWNDERRWPKAYLHVANPDKDTIGTIVLEEQIDLEKGIHQELLDDLTTTILMGAHLFWEWAHKEKGL